MFLKVADLRCREPADTIERVSRQSKLDVAQVYGSETPKMRFWRATRITEFRPDAVGGAEAVLVDAPSETLLGGTGETFDWSMARHIAERVIVAGGLDHTNVREHKSPANPGAWTPARGWNCRLGGRSPREVRKFIKAAKEA